VSALREEDIAAVLDTLRSGWLTMGPRIQAFEAEFAAWTGAPHAVACSSGTAALHLALLAERLEPGAPVLVPALGGCSAAQAVRHAGGEPVFADVVAPAVPVLDVVDVERRLAGGAAAAVVVVHAFGHGADAGLLQEVCAGAGAHLVEDARAAVGAVVGAHDRQAGTLGRSGCFSFADGRQLPMGEGGMVVTADEAVAARVRLLRAHAMTSGTWDRHRGHADSYDVVDVGFNFRLDEPRAALGSSRLRHLAADLEARRTTARAWRAALAGVEGVEPCFGPESPATSSHGAFAVLTADAAARDAALAALGGAGLTAWAEPALSELPRAAEAAERLVAVAVEPGVPAATVVSALRGG
jgi:dTDP-4-amino-4,6-dideoxygalactose transaminase